MTCSTTVNRPLRGPLAVRMLELQPGLFSKISESFNVLHPMISKRLHSCRAEDQPLPGIAASDTHIGFWVVGRTLRESCTPVRVTPSLDQTTSGWAAPVSLGARKVQLTTGGADAEAAHLESMQKRGEAEVAGDGEGG